MRQNGYWANEERQARQAQPALRGRRAADVAVIGGGLSGVNIALWLIKAGLRVALIEADRVGCGASSRCAGMLSLASGLRYARLEASAGVSRASAYAQTQLSALNAIRELCKSEGFSSELHDADVQLVTDEKGGERLLNVEAEAMRRAGIAASVGKPTHCPLPAQSALALGGMATLNPASYLRSMLSEAEALGLKLFEGSRVTAVETNLAYTERGSVLAPYIVVATGYPIVNVPGWYFLKLRQRRSSLIPVPDAPAFDGMYYDMRGGFALRRSREGALFVQSSLPASGDDARETYAERYAPFLGGAYPRQVYGGFEAYSPDGLPYIGAYSRKTPNLFVATGYDGSGLIGAMTAAQAISAAILGLGGDSYDVLSGSRGARADGLRAALSIGGAYVKSQLHARAPRCPHMGCRLRFNRATRLWECPCHGSRFDDIGHVLSAPAVYDAQISRR